MPFNLRDYSSDMNRMLIPDINLSVFNAFCWEDGYELNDSQINEHLKFCSCVVCSFSLIPNIKYNQFELYLIIMHNETLKLLDSFGQLNMLQENIFDPENGAVWFFHLQGAGIALRPHLSDLVCCMLESLSSLEDQGLNYVEVSFNIRNSDLNIFFILTSY